MLHGSGAEQIAAAARLLVLMAVARVAAQTRDDARMLERLVGIVEHRAADGRTAGVGALPQQLGEPVAVPHLHVVVLVIFMDIMMPKLNGWDATRRIRSMKRSDAGNVPIIAMSANAFAEDIINSRWMKRSCWKQ